MNLAASSFHSLKASSAAFAARSLARPAFGRCQSRLAAIGTRHYSEQAKAQEEASPKTEDSKPDVSELEKKLKAKEEEVTDLTGRLRYLQADFLNLQRNAAREKEQTRDYAISKFAGDLLETVDVLSIALKSVPPPALKPSNPPSSSSDADTPPTLDPPLPKNHDAYLRELHEGVEMTQRQLLQTLFKYHVKPFDPVGDKFDPNHHEALYQAPVPGKEAGTVIDCQKIGYKIKDRVLRAAQVGVAQDTS